MGSVGWCTQERIRRGRQTLLTPRKDFFFSYFFCPNEDIYVSNFKFYLPFGKNIFSMKKKDVLQYKSLINKR